MNTTVTKRCARCGEEKSPGEYRKGTAKDGLQSYCKPCQTSANREWRRANPEKYRAARRRRYARDPERALAEVRQRPLEMRRAHKALNNATYRGKIERATECERCGVDDCAIVAHHPDYSKPLDVEWVCSRCHHEIHEVGRG